MRQFPGQHPQQRGQIARRAQPRPAHRHAQIRAAILLKHQPGIAPGKGVEFDRIADQPGKRRMWRQPDAYPHRRIVADRRVAQRAAQVVLAGGEEQGVARYRRAIAAVQHRPLGRPDRHAPLDPCAGPPRSIQQQRIEAQPGQANGGGGQRRLGAAPAGEQRDAAHLMSAQRRRIDSGACQRLERSPRQEPATQRILRFA